jgi:hypothetical protein
MMSGSSAIEELGANIEIETLRTVPMVGFQSYF